MLKALRPYWRAEYAAVPQGGHGDVFEFLKTADAKAHFIIAKGKTACLLLNRFPYAPGHLLVVPFRRVDRLEKLTDEETLELQHFVVLGKLLVEKVLKTDGVNVGLNQGRVSGGSVPQHLHWHIVPRWQGDHSFMPVIGNTRILPRSQESVWRALMKAYKAVK